MFQNFSKPHYFYAIMASQVTTSSVACLHIYAFLHACHLATTILPQSAKFEANP